MGGWCGREATREPNACPHCPRGESKQLDLGSSRRLALLPCGRSLGDGAAWFRKPVPRERLHLTAGTLPGVRATKSGPCSHPQVTEHPGFREAGLLAARTLSGLKPGDLGGSWHGPHQPPGLLCVPGAGAQGLEGTRRERPPSPWLQPWRKVTSIPSQATGSRVEPTGARRGGEGNAGPAECQRANLSPATHRHAMQVPSNSKVRRGKLRSGSRKGAGSF